MTTIQRSVVFALSLFSFLGFCLWLYFDPGFEPAIGIAVSGAGIAAMFWPRFRKKYKSRRLSGRATFDYSNNNGIFTIGTEELLFETKWSSSGADSIHLYNDPESIQSVAIATGAHSIESVTDASTYDSSSRARTVHEGEVAILKNKHGNYAALHVLDVKNRGRGDAVHEITFRYVINPDGFVSFAI